MGDDPTLGSQRHQREGILLFVQIDHLPGDLLSEALTRLCSAGAKNVQLLATLTKKGRPGQLLIVDVPVKLQTAIEEVLLSEVGVTGWHALTTEHVYFSTEILDIDVAVSTPNGVLRHQVSGKRLARTGSELVPEHRSCVELRERLLSRCGMSVPLREVARLIGEALNNGEEHSIDLRERGSYLLDVPEKRDTSEHLS
jgi:uncharacterized protein (DUF111 family)